MRNVGVPPGGAFDVESHELANGLLGNGSGVEALELAMARLEIRCLCGGSAAWVGAGAWNSSFSFSAGDVLTLVAPFVACRSYLALPGGVWLDGPVARGAMLFGSGRAGVSRRLSSVPLSLGEGRVAVVRGPQADLLSFERFVGADHQVGRDLDRVGVRLAPVAGLEHGLDLPSEPACVGAIQITPNGTPIVLGPDGPTIGGYPKIAVVPTFEIGRIGQLAPGQAIRFREVGLEEARRMSVSWRQDLERRLRILSLLGGSRIEPA